MEQSKSSLIVRSFGWSVMAVALAFLVNNYLTNWLGWPGVRSILDDSPTMQGGIQAALPAGGILLALLLVRRSSHRTLRQDARALDGLAAVLISCAFWTVLIVGLADWLVSFLRVEGLLAQLVGEQMTQDLGRSNYRGLWLHMPLIALSIVIGLITRRTLGFTWLTLLVVGAELEIVLSRFIFSYEQAFMGDLVRFWYAALFLFSSAYTLLEEGHVRVDVLYTNFSPRTKGLVNAIGSVVLGMALCWIILALGMWDKTNIINSPLLSFEVTQSGFGMYVKYLMAGFLAVFAVSMMIQFTSMLLDGVADHRDEPGRREPAAPASS